MHPNQEESWLPNKMINLLDYRVREVGKMYYLEFIKEASTQRWQRILITKVVMGCNKKGEFCVMARNIIGELGFWIMGGYCVKINDGCKESNYADIAFRNGRSYAVNYEGVTIPFDSLSLKVTQVAVAPIHNLTDRYLVNSLEGNWISVNGLGDQVIFLGKDCCCSVSAKDFAELKKNCIYFTDYCFVNDAKYDDFPGWNAGLFNLEDNIARPLKSKFSGLPQPG
ncbi:hypothetical protein FEM48_Zijuj01G0106400 [Ziziphus jujuba var. spinosa]|uniref:KIB1-4 beta-propeller domain-containing protein n=1 Tax=Ziziphus jujuba var. spinosa TaxID=714518 RepID=A0A978W0S5_ZIZJJ|nr:hypothetical protein FEM48_Zijuj01G0106400 [Ziziphus jujuba var. spinosa]